VEKTLEGDYWVYKRGGVATSSQPSGGAAAGLGMYNWLGDIYAVFGAVLYKNGSSVGAVDSTASYRFDSTLGATPQLVLGNGAKAYTYDSGGGLVLISDGDFPAAFVKGWCYLDGTLYVATAAATVQGSDINDPTAWDPLNYLTAQIEPDQGVALAKQLVYAVIFKQWSTEIFYDAGNSTGSPLGAVQGAKVNYGCVTADSVQELDGILFWVCTNKSASTQVIKMEGLKVEIVSNDPVERLLDDAGFATTYSFVVKDNGHRFYVLTCVVTNITLAYDLDQKMWSQWTDVDGNYFPFVSSTYDSSTLGHYLQHATNGYIYTYSVSNTTDAGAVITVDIVTPNFDGGVYRRKQLNMIKFEVDRAAGSVLQVRHNDNDYGTKDWTNFRQVDLGNPQPMLGQEGTFVRRAYHLRHQSQTALRIKALELQIDLGTL
tara:strand:- start:858 stop:2150 length:1293 start_codon:yes stop_codon:yes gene_type:complete